MDYGSVEPSGAYTIRAEIIKDPKPISSEQTSSLGLSVDLGRFAGICPSKTHPAIKVQVRIQTQGLHGAGHVQRQLPEAEHWERNLALHYNHLQLYAFALRRVKPRTVNCPFLQVFFGSQRARIRTLSMYKLDRYNIIVVRLLKELQ